MEENAFQLTEKLKSLREYFDILVATADGYPFVTDLESQVVMVSPKLVEDYDLPSDVLTDFDSCWLPLIYPEDQKAYADSINEVMGPDGSDDHEMEYRVMDRHGEYRWLHCHGRVGRKADGTPSIFAGIIVKMDRIHHADPVTGLLNRFSFRLAVDKTMESCTSGVIMILGIKDFHKLNSIYDQNYLDKVLKQVGKNLKQALPTQRTLYKLDGNEFGLIWPYACPEEVELIYAGLKLSLRTLQRMDDKLKFKLSAGAVFFPEHGETTAVLQKHLRAAMAMARQDPHGRLCIFLKEEYEDWIREVELQRAFEKSVEEGCTGFELHFQPQVDAKTQKLLGAEALLRWRDAEGNLMSPMQFIPLLEKTRLIVPIGRWIVEEAVKVCAEWQKYQPDFNMSINVSLFQLDVDTFKDCVRAALFRCGVKPKNVTLELTETQSVSDWKFVNGQFAHLRRMGVRVAIDDFGVGYSSLARLKYFNCDMIKMDKVFVDRILDCEFDRQLVKYAVGLCHSIGMKVCMEGVEDKESYEYLMKECNADIIQGYYFGRPEPKDVFVKRFSVKSES